MKAKLHLMVEGAIRVWVVSKFGRILYLNPDREYVLGAYCEFLRAAERRREKRKEAETRYQERRKREAEIRRAQLRQAV